MYLHQVLQGCLKKFVQLRIWHWWVLPMAELCKCFLVVLNLRVCDPDLHDWLIISSNMVIWTAVTRSVSHSNLSLKSLTWRPECTLSCQLLQQPALVELTVVEELTVHCLEHHQWSPVSHCWRGRLSGWRWSGCRVWHFFAPLLCRSVMGLLTGNRKQSVQPCCECNEGVWSVCSGGGGCWWHPVSPGEMQSLANWTVEPLWRCDPAHQL